MAAASTGVFGQRERGAVDLPDDVRHGPGHPVLRRPDSLSEGDRRWLCSRSEAGRYRLRLAFGKRSPSPVLLEPRARAVSATASSLRPLYEPGATVSCRDQHGRTRHDASLPWSNGTDPAPWAVGDTRPHSPRTLDPGRSGGGRRRLWRLELLIDEQRVAIRPEGAGADYRDPGQPREHGDGGPAAHQERHRRSNGDRAGERHLRQAGQHEPVRHGVLRRVPCRRQPQAERVPDPEPRADLQSRRLRRRRGRLRRRRGRLRAPVSSCATPSTPRGVSPRSATPATGRRPSR